MTRNTACPNVTLSPKQGQEAAGRSLRSAACRLMQVVVLTRSSTPCPTIRLRATEKYKYAAFGCNNGGAAARVTVGEDTHS